MTSSDVFIEKRYRYEDVCIGWEFAGLLYVKDSRRKDVKKEVCVDLNLIHDIVPQSGGGNEPLSDTSVRASRHGTSSGSFIAAV